MDKKSRSLISISAFAVIFVAALLLAKHGLYGWTLFIMLPVISGALGAWSVQPETVGHAIRIGAMIGVLGCSLFLLLGVEGLICVAMAMPLAIPLTVVGSLLVYWSISYIRSDPKRPAAMILLLPVSLFFDESSKPRVYSVTTSTVVNAPPERVWKYVVAFPISRRGPIGCCGPGWPIRHGHALKTAGLECSGFVIYRPGPYKNVW